MTRAEIVAAPLRERVARAIYEAAPIHQIAFRGLVDIPFADLRTGQHINLLAQADAAIALCFTEAAEMCDELRPQFEPDDSFIERERKADTWGWLTVAAERLRALAHGQGSAPSNTIPTAHSKSSEGTP